MKRLTLFLTAVLSIFLLAGSAFAAGTGTEMTAGAYSEEALRGLTVVNREGEELGEIREVRVDSETGEINFVILARGGVLGIGAERYAVPIEALKISRDKDKATLTVSENKLETAPRQETGMSDGEFKDVIQKHYGVAPAWEPPASRGITPEMME
jgi:sporulation protein YlmC with PRC-barrel domain